MQLPLQLGPWSDIASVSVGGALGVAATMAAIAAVVVLMLILDVLLRGPDLSLLCNDWRFGAGEQEQPGGVATLAGETGGFAYRFDVLAYYGRCGPNALRSTRVLFARGANTVYVGVPTGSGGVPPPRLEFTPGRWVRFSFEGRLNTAEAEAAAGWTAVYFVADDPEGLERRWLIESRQPEAPTLDATAPLEGRPPTPDAEAGV